MTNNKLSIIIPVFNAEKYVAECLESLMNFLGEQLEIIIVDDGSTDNSAIIISECQKKDSRIHYIRVQNGGVSKARNIGIDSASGDYIMFLDADDYLIQDAFITLSEIVNSNTYDFIAFSRLIVQEGKDSWNDKYSFDDIDTADKKTIDLIMYADSHFNECWGKIYKKEIIDKFEISFAEDVPIGEDLMFVMDYYSNCNKVYVSNIPLVAYRQHESSTMRKYDVRDRLRFTERLFHYAKSHLPPAYNDEFWYYNFKIITNLCREYSYNSINPKVIKLFYNSILAQDVLANLKKDVVPNYRRHEFILMRQKLYTISALYYHFKAFISK